MDFYCALGPEAARAGYRLEVFTSLGSTNDEAMSRIAAGDPGRLWIVAATQTRGRGRMGRVWVSPPGNLYASLLLIDPAPPDRARRTRLCRGRRLDRRLARHDRRRPPDSPEMAERRSVRRRQAVRPAAGRREPAQRRVRLRRRHRRQLPDLSRPMRLIPPPVCAASARPRRIAERCSLHCPIRSRIGWRSGRAARIFPRFALPGWSARAGSGRSRA